MTTSIERKLHTLRGADMAEAMTGCEGAGDFMRWAEQQGYPHCEVVDWSSSAGDWTFLVSKDGEAWYIMSQTNNYPHSGFTREIDESQCFEGASEEVLQQVSEMY